MFLEDETGGEISWQEGCDLGSHGSVTGRREVWDQRKWSVVGGVKRGLPDSCKTWVKCGRLELSK